MIPPILLPLIVFIGTASDLRQNAAPVASHFEAGYQTIRDRHALARFPRATGWMYRARWTKRVLRKRYSKGFPAVYIVFGRETVSGLSSVGCTIGNAITCEAGKVAECVEAARETSCRL